MTGPLTYGKLVSRARLDAGLTQADLANDIRIKRETVSRWERDKLIVTPSAAEMHRLTSRLPELTEIQLLWSLGYDLKPMVDDRGHLVGPQGVASAASLSDQEIELVETYRRLSPTLRRVVLRQVEAAAPPPLGRITTG